MECLAAFDFTPVSPARRRILPRHQNSTCALRGEQHRLPGRRSRAHRRGFATTQDDPRVAEQPRTYLSQHLRQNDYWAEGEKQVCGEWIGQAAARLGLEGAVTDAPFEALRSNRDWRTGKRQTTRANKKTRMALFDIQISAYLRQAFYRELAGRLRQLGYEPYEMNATGFSIRGVEHLRERFSKRSREVKALTEDFSRKKGRQATKREIEVLVRESRAKKLLEVTTPEVRARQRTELTREEMRALEALVRHTMTHAPRETLSQGHALTVLNAAIRHVYERRSVVREGEVLSAALELHPHSPTGERCDTRSKNILM